MTLTQHRTPPMFMEGAGRRLLLTLINNTVETADFDLDSLVYSKSDYHALIQHLGDKMWGNELQTAKGRLKLYSTDDPETSHISPSNGVPIAVLVKGDEQIHIPFPYVFLNKNWKFDDIWELIIQLTEIPDQSGCIKHFYSRGFKTFRRQRGEPVYYWLSIARNGVMATTQTAKSFRKCQEVS